MANTQEMIENLFKSIDIIADKKLKELEYDKTITCSILDNKYASRGEYTVSDGATVFKAYADITTYQVGQYVYVKIINGDFSNQKLIIGKYTDDDTEYYTYVSPMNSYLDITRNLIEKENTSSSILANGTTTEKLIWRVFDRNYKGYNKIGLRAGFRTWLSQYNLEQGNYGLHLYIVSEEKTGTLTGVPSYTLYTCTLDTNDFYGDVYKYETYYTQEKVFDISDIENIVEMRLYLFQEGNFIEDGTLIPSKESETAIQELPDNISMASPYVSLGYDLDTFTEDTVLLYTLDPISYAAALTDEKKAELIAQLDLEDEDERNKILYDADTAKKYLTDLNKRILQMRWVSFDINDKAFAIDSMENLPESALVHWYRYNLKEGVEDELAGPFWKEEKLPSNDSFEYKYFNPRITEKHEMVKVIVEYPSREDVSKKIYNANILKEIETKYNISKNNDETYYKYLNRIKEKLVSDIENKRNLLENYEIQAKEVADIQSRMDAAVAAAESQGKTQAEIAEIKEEYIDQVDKLVENTQKDYEELNDIKDKILSYESETEYYKSEVLEFTNETSIPDGSSIDLISGLDIKCDVDGYNGCYRIYDSNGDILSKNEGSKKRLLTATYQSIVTGDNTLDSAEKIYWYFPINNSMIELPKENSEYSFYDEISLTATTYKPDSSFYIKTSDNVFEPSTSAYSNTTKYYTRNNTTTTNTDDGQYFVICRTGVSLGTNPGEAENKNDEQYFRIKSYYSQSLVNNTIICAIEKNGLTYRKECSLVFGPSGTNGTSYTLVLEMADNIPAVTASTTTAYPVIVIPHLYDYQNKEITATYAAEGKISYSWYSSGNEGIGLSDVNSKDGSVKLISLTDKFDDYKYYILKCSISKVLEIVPNNGITLEAYLPIPVRASEIYTSFEGADKIVYNTAGGSPQFYKDGYKIYKYDSSTNKNTAVTSGISWSMSLGEDTKGEAAGASITAYYPKVTTNGILTAPGMFLKENGKQVGVTCTTDGKEVWFQPLYIYQDSFSSALLNSWDGSLTIDEKNGTILSTMIGAGKKDKFNRFNGVLMGDISTAENTKDTGLYGYHEGVRSFGLNIDGTAFIGKSGKAQIKFDGNSGYIQSGNFGKDNSGGLKIDLDGKKISIIGERYSTAKAVSDGRTYNSITDAADAQKAFYNSAITNLNVEINKINSTLTSYTNKKNDYNNRINELKISVNQYKSKINELKAQINTITNNIANDRISVTQKQSQIAANTKKIVEAQKNKKLSTVARMNTISTLTNNNSNLESQILSLNNEIRNYETQKTALTVQESYYEREVEKANTKITTYTNEINKLNNTQELVNKKTSCQKEVDIYNSLINKINTHINTLKAVPSGSSYDIERIQKQNALATYLSENGNEVELKYSLTNSQILLSAFDPYLKIVSESNKTLMQIGDGNYFLQTNDYVGNSNNVVGKGVKLDLSNGNLDAYNFNLRAYNSDTNSDYFGSYVQLKSNGNPYLNVHYKSKSQARDLDVLKITNDAFVLNSHDWQNGSAGICLDLARGNLSAYNNFTLKATDTSGSYVTLSSSGNPFFQVHYKSGARELDLIKIGSSDWFMNSQNWNNDAGTGINFNMTNGRITAYNFMIKASKKVNNEPKSIIINSSDENYPLRIGDNFKVSWEGKIDANYITARGGQIGPFIISSSALYNSTNNGNFGPKNKGVYIGNSGLLINNTDNGTDFLVRTSPDSEQYTLYVGGKTNLHGNTLVSGTLKTTGTVNFGDILELQSDGKLHLSGDLIVSGSISDSGGKWSHTGNTKNGGTQQVNGTSGTIGGWTVGGDSLSGGSTSLNSNGNIQIGNITIDGSRAGNENIQTSSTTLTLGTTLTSISNKLSCQGITCGQKATFTAGADITGDLDVTKKVTTKDLEVNGSFTFGNNGKITLPKELNIIWQAGEKSSSKVTYDASSVINFGIKLLHLKSTDNKNNKYINLCASLTSSTGSPGLGTITLGNLAFADDIKKKFSMTIDMSKHISKSATTFYMNGKNQYRVVAESGTLYKKGSSTTTYYERDSSYTAYSGGTYTSAIGYVISKDSINNTIEWKPFDGTKIIHWDMSSRKVYTYNSVEVDKYSALQASDYAYIPKEFDVTTNTITFEGASSSQGDTIDLGTH